MREKFKLAGNHYEGSSRLGPPIRTSRVRHRKRLLTLNTQLAFSEILLAVGQLQFDLI